MTTPKKKHILSLLTTLFIIVVVFYLFLCSILGINARRSEMCADFMELLAQDNVEKTWKNLSPDYQAAFYNEKDFFRLAARLFLNSLPGYQGGPDGVIPSFQAKAALVFWPDSQQTLTVTVFSVQPDREQKEVLVDQVKSSLPFHEKTVSGEAISINLVNRDSTWLIDSVSFDGNKLDNLTMDKLVSSLPFMSIEQIRMQGDLLFRLKQSELARRCYEELYTRLSAWDDHIRFSLGHLADMWREENHEKLPELLSHLK